MRPIGARMASGSLGDKSGHGGRGTSMLGPDRSGRRSCPLGQRRRRKIISLSTNCRNHRARSGGLTFLSLFVVCFVTLLTAVTRMTREADLNKHFAKEIFLPREIGRDGECSGGTRNFHLENRNFRSGRENFCRQTKSSGGTPKLRAETEQFRRKPERERGN